MKSHDATSQRQLMRIQGVMPFFSITINDDHPTIFLYQLWESMGMEVAAFTLIICRFLEHFKCKTIKDKKRKYFKKIFFAIFSCLPT